MSRRAIAAIVAAAAGCATPLVGAPHHHPDEIYRRLAPQGRFSAPAPLPALERPVVVVARAWVDRVLAPTGVYLDDWNAEGVVTETYLTPRLTDHLYLAGVAHLRAAGAQVLRSYGPYRGPPSADLRVLEVEIAHAELHRWAREALFDGAEGTVDLARVDYEFRWSDGEGRPVSAGRGRVELLLPPDGDDVDAVARALVGDVLARLR